MVDLTPADIADSTGAQAVLEAVRKRWPAVKHLFADGAYDRTALMDKTATLDFVIEIARRHEQQTGFVVLPRRWVVERTFGWMVRRRRLVRDYEQRADISEAMIHIAMGSLLLRRIAHSGEWSCAAICGRHRCHSNFGVPRQARRAVAKRDPAERVMLPSIFSRLPTLSDLGSLNVPMTTKDRCSRSRPVSGRPHEANRPCRCPDNDWDRTTPI